MSAHVGLDRLDLIWPRLESIADEVAVTLVKTAFSHDVVECRDMAVAICDGRGYLLAHSHLGATGHIGSVPGFMRSLMARYADGGIEEGDVIACNDPWVAAGHTPDVFLASPVFHRGALAAFVVTAVHHADIGGRAGAGDVTEIYEEGLLLPIVKLWRRGVAQTDLLDVIHRNVRFGDLVVGDLRAQVAAGETGITRLRALFVEQGLDGLDAIGDVIIERTERAMRDGTIELGPGVYRAGALLDAHDVKGERLRLELTMTIHEDGRLDADFAGTSNQQPAPINCPIQYALAYTVIAIKLACRSDLPINEGAYRAIRVSAPEGSLLNPTFPSPVFWRLSTGLLVAELILQCVRQAAPDRAPAESGSLPVWQFYVTGTHADGRPFSLHQHGFGGMGARSGRDGLSSVSFPYNVRDVSVEGVELETPVLVTRRELLVDSGGAGRWRGGLGEIITLRAAPGGDIDATAPIVLSGGAGRLHEGPAGVGGGRSGSPGSIAVNGRPIPPAVLGNSPHVVFGPDDEVTLRLPGGGGYGPPADREREAAERDLVEGLVTRESAPAG